MKKFIYFLSLLLLAGGASAQLSTLYQFTGQLDGGYPEGALLHDSTVLYGTTYQGGAANKGTIFRVQSDGTGYTTLLDFAGATNGSFPTGALISDGTWLFGMTQQGGTYGLGCVFKIRKDGSGFAKIYDFNSVNGRYPQGSLIFDGTWLYGMSLRGGANDSGAIFRLLPDGTLFSKIFDFSGTADGGYPYGSLMKDSAWLYGTTYLGGLADKGTVFRIQTNGSGFTQLYSFTGTGDGSYPASDLTSDGTWLYGTTQQGGTNDLGTVFRMHHDGTFFQMLIEFDGAGNGSLPYTGSLLQHGGYLYGLTQSGGALDEGTVFRMLPDGTGFQKLHEFVDTANGSYPYSSLISDGTYLYGTTEQGGSSGAGTVFRYLPAPTGIERAPELPCFVAGTVGRHLTIGCNTVHASQAELLNLVGAKVATIQLERGKMTTLDLSDFANGVYVLSVRADEGVFKKKILVQ